jgi:hypothetical protein
MERVGLKLVTLNAARRSFGSNGTQTVWFSLWWRSWGTAVTESWNGTSWTEVNDLNTS